MPHSRTPADGERYDVVVVGGGNAAFSAAHSARENGASVLVLEKAPEAEAGGNSYYTAGAFRLAHGGLADVRPLLDDPCDERLDSTRLPAYPVSAFTADMERVTDGRNDPEMTRVMVDDSAATVRWLLEKGLRWELLYQRQTYLEDGVWVFFGGLALGTVGGGKGLVAQHTEAARASGVEIRYGARVTDLLREGPAVTGVAVRGEDGEERRIAAGAVVLAAGGFESSADLRRKHLGEGWERALVRGTPLNTGEVLGLALAHGAAPHGDWSSCHSVQWDAGAPPEGGERDLTNGLTRQSYPVGIVVNQDGERFIDEGADYRNYTYAKYGRKVLRQPGGRAFQIFDAKTRPLLRAHEYDNDAITGATADSLEELAAELGIDPGGLTRTVERFNASVHGPEFTPSVKDGRAAHVRPPKSNWALQVDSPPYYGYAVACGITFTFGGLRIAPGSAGVIDTAGAPIPGLYAAGEIVGGLFSGNYPGGSGLIAGAVFGRRAGAAAGAAARRG
ncbi:tricarballylate dehydrogenase [Spinactinospora alkalitolerans]|uniref:Tricarballylate dehydrogenase n=1 Tax=Spinactinospora alkalitolerans TaxID=687207 RepID=A0A852U847_9ACTN|nr:FAD-dependent tricarballylate dehydrogenase TcuA [Spinactinospora alkalitolerans]NYE50234.1 tricarballylate dehydrogenase [Spinactinospora alkalitolerans]